MIQISGYGKTSLMLMGISWAFQARFSNAAVKNPTELESNTLLRDPGRPAEPRLSAHGHELDPGESVALPGGDSELTTEPGNWWEP